MRSRLRLAAALGGVAVLSLLVPLAAHAQPPPPPPDASGAATTTPPATSSAPAPAPTPPATVQATTENNPPPTLPSTAAHKPGDDLEPGQHFTIDPVSDGVITVGGLGFAAILGLVLGTGEIAPTQPVLDKNGQPDPSVLLSIDRGAVSQTFDKNANTFSDIGLYTAVGFTVIDTVLSGVRDGWDAGLVDAVMYAESISLTLTLTDITKIAVRRPRPFDYQNFNAAMNTSTNNELSFFSGHASTVAAITGTASYLAFVRSPHSIRPWLTLILGTALTAFVSYERVRGGDHFPTDVITGALAGGAVGVLVPHLHRHKTEAPNVWIGGAPAPTGNGGALTLTGFF